MTTFYMIYVEGQKSPTHKHTTYESAVREAKRLAEYTKEKTYILCSIESYELNRFEIKDLRPSGLPF